MNLSEQLNEAHKVTEAKAIPLPDVKFELVGFGKDTNGNSIAKYKSGKGKGFSIQTNGNLPATHAIKISGKKAKELDAKELATIADETKLYIEANGTQKMRESITVEEALGEKLTQHKTVVVSSKDKGISSKHFNSALKHLKSMKDGESTDDEDKKGDLAPLLLYKLDLSGSVGATFTSAKLMDDSRITFKNVTIEETKKPVEEKLSLSEQYMEMK